MGLVVLNSAFNILLFQLYFHSSTIGKYTKKKIQFCWIKHSVLKINGTSVYVRDYYMHKCHLMLQLINILLWYRSVVIYNHEWFIILYLYFNGQYFIFETFGYLFIDCNMTYYSYNSFTKWINRQISVITFVKIKSNI